MGIRSNDSVAARLCTSTRGLRHPAMSAPNVSGARYITVALHPVAGVKLRRCGRVCGIVDTRWLVVAVGTNASGVPKKKKTQSCHGRRC